MQKISLKDHVNKIIINIIMSVHMQKIAPKDHVNKYFNYYVCTYEENIIIITILGLHICKK